MRIRLLAALAAGVFAALLAGCAETPYYGGTYYSYGYSDYYGPGYYDGPDYYYYGPSYYYSPGIALSYAHRSGDGGGHWDGSNWSSRSFQQGSVPAQPRTSNRMTAQPRVRTGNATVAHAGRHVETHRAARQPSHVASQTRTGPDREHGG